MLVFFVSQLAKGQPFQVQSQHASFSQIDAALLLVLNRFSRSTHVSVDIQNCRKLASDILRLIQNGGGLKARHDFVAELACSVSLSGMDQPEVFELRRGGHPFLGPAVKDNVLQQVLTQTLGFCRPLQGRGRSGRLGDPLQKILPQLK